MEAGCFGGAHMQQGWRRVSEFDAEVVQLGVKILHDGRAGTQTGIQFFARIVVDEIELDILIAAALSGLGIHLAKQVELCALIGLSGFGGRLGGFGGRLVVGGRQESEEYEDGR